MRTIQEILNDLENKKSEFNLEGVELTEEDAMHVANLVKEGSDYTAAMNEVLAGISECLGNDEVDLSDNLQMYDGSYDDETLENEGLCIVTWPDSQDLLELPYFWKHAKLINDEEGLDAYGSSAYVVEEKWYLEQFC